MNGTVYLIHLDEPIGSATNPRGRAQHYIGWALDHELRLQEHRAGRGARLLRSAVTQGVPFDVVRTWEDVDRHFERALKNLKKSRLLCPTCSATAVASPPLDR